LSPDEKIERPRRGWDRSELKNSSQEGAELGSPADEIAQIVVEPATDGAGQLPSDEASQSW
jgi:hypothetical protein